jgi:hypothetical protein
MTLHLSKVAVGCPDIETLARLQHDRWGDAQCSLTRFMPKRAEELIGGSLFWIINHAIVARSPITAFVKTEDGRWDIVLEPKLIRVHQIPKRAHQGWRYLTEEKAPRDVAEGEDIGDALPGKLAAKLERLGLV